MIFISHRQIDQGMAVKIAEYLKGRGVPHWVDVLDPATRGSIDITKHIVATIDKCSHLIVVFSVNTAGSMWVPFELGAAYKAGKGIGTYMMDGASTPEYLNAFPRMKSGTDLDHYIAEYQSDQRMVKSLNERNVRFDGTSSADSFISRMKGRLRQ